MVYITIGANHSTPTQGRTTFFTQIIFSPRSKQGELNTSTPSFINSFPMLQSLPFANALLDDIHRCNIAALVAETDRILRPEGKLIVRDNSKTVNELENMFKSMKWEVRFTYFKDNEALLCVQKSMWRPNESETLQYAIA